MNSLSLDLGYATLARQRAQRPPAFASDSRSTSILACAGPVELSIVVPTYNERGNIETLVSRIAEALPRVRWEVIIVDDDSPDHTAGHTRSLYNDDARVRVIRRIGRRGLSSACMEGMLSASGSYIAVMDADLQHDPGMLRSMLDDLRTGDIDLVVASRHVEGGSTGPWARSRETMSRFAAWVAWTATAVELADPMSGYFALRREVIDRWAPRLSVIGYKILLDIVLTAGPSLRIREVPLRFAQREYGESKLSPRVAWDFAMMLADKMFGHIIPVRLFSFACVGMVGIAVHLLVLALLVGGVGIAFLPAQIAAAAIAMTSNYAINNVLTYSDRRQQGLAWFAGLLCFYLVCGIGALANVTFSGALLDIGIPWELAALAGTLVGLIWNYGASTRFTWSAAP